MLVVKRRKRRPLTQLVPQFPDLATYLIETGDTQVRMAKALGISQAHVCRLVNGDAVPRPPLAVRVATYASVPLDSFARVYLAKRHAQAHTVQER